MFKKMMLVIMFVMFPLTLFAAEFKISDDHKILYYTGDVVYDDISTLKDKYDEYNFDKIVLSSGGGEFFASMAMSAFIIENGIKTEVQSNEKCMSACAFMWMSGVERILSKESSIGFHLPYISSNGISLEEYLRLEKKAHGLLTWLIGFNNINIDMYFDLLEFREKNKDVHDLLFFSPDLSKKWMISVVVSD